MRARLFIADRLRRTLTELGSMPVAEFNMHLAFHAERNRSREDPTE